MPPEWARYARQLGRDHIRPEAAHPGESAGVVHFGFRLVDPNDIDEAVEEVEAAGGRQFRRGEFAPGFPFACVSGGYEIEIWFE